MAATILEPGTDAEILATYDVMRQLRPHLTGHEYPGAVRRLMETQGYCLAALAEDGQAKVSRRPAIISRPCCKPSLPSVCSASRRHPGGRQ